MNRSGAIAFLLATYRSLSEQQDLSPNNPSVNRALGALVAALQQWQARRFGANLLEDQALAEVASSLPKLCGAAECEMEKWWARRILQSGCAGVQALEAFWYLDNYRALCQAEWRLMAGSPSRRYAFLGSGALPMTAILLAETHPEVAVRCIDRDPDACDLAERLVRRLNLSHRIAICPMSAEDLLPLADETVICASLLSAGDLYPGLHRAGARRLLIRDAEGVYRFCYRPAALPQSGYVQRGRTPLSAARINTSLYYEATAAA
jgi:hypothetical protein